MYVEIEVYVCMYRGLIWGLIAGDVGGRVTHFRVYVSYYS